MSQRARTVAVLVFGGVLGVVVTAIVGALILGSQTVYATPERRSAFLKTYTPNTVIKTFQSPGWYGGSGASDNPHAGEHATFQKMFDARFAMRSEDRKALTAALHQGIVDEVRDAGGWVYDTTGDDAVGYRLRYVDGKSIGTISVGPALELDPDHLGGLYADRPRKESLLNLSPGEIPVEVTISIEEIWMRGH
jgi:hypothetical protein